MKEPDEIVKCPCCGEDVLIDPETGEGLCECGETVYSDMVFGPDVEFPK